MKLFPIADNQLTAIADELKALADFCEDPEWIKYRLETIAENVLPEVARTYGNVVQLQKMTNDERVDAA